MTQCCWKLTNKLKVIQALVEKHDGLMGSQFWTYVNSDRDWTEINQRWES